jgi:hypothetical protein
MALNMRFVQTTTGGYRIRTLRRSGSPRESPLQRLVPFILLLCAAFVCFIPIRALATEPSEYEVKAAFVYNFIKFVEWPSHSFTAEDSPFVVGVLGQDPMNDALESLRGKTAQGRKLAVKRFNRMGDLDRCHVLYVGRSEKEQIAAVLKATTNLNVLTVADMKGFAQAGGVVNFITQENRISFEINVGTAERAGLKVSSKLLKLARIVGSDGRRQDK